MDTESDPTTTTARLSTNWASSDGISERRLSSDSLETTSIRWSVMRQIFAGNHLDPLFEIYTHKTNHGYISAFLILMAIVSFTHFFLVLGLNMDDKTLDVVTLDLITYITVGVLSIVGLYVSEKYVKERPKLLTALSAFAFFALFVMNIIVPLFHFFANKESYRPVYTTLFILSCYIFFNITSNLYAAILGFAMSALHIIVLVFITYDANFDRIGERIGSDAIYLFCVNAFGIYFRLMTEIMKRRSFLDRRTLVESTLKLKYEEEQGEQLIASVIPKKAMSKLKQYAEITVRMIHNEIKVRPINPWQFDIKEHSNVTILYADIVNYTKMTTTLKSLQLVETLNELFGRFDDASEELKVLRVKFLGDCYYCVAGLEPEIPHHAEASVDLGLRMINIIQDVKKIRNLPIDMRIGIHSGDIFSGVIGACKWQFDIWSKDVSIANRMETTGQAGKVHITRQTMDQLKKSYDIMPSEAGDNDQLLKQNNIETFLITPEDLQDEEPRNDYLLHVLRRGSSTQDVERRVRISEGNLTNGHQTHPSPDDRRVRNSENALTNGVRPSTGRKRESIYIPNRQPNGNPALINGRISHRRRTTPGEISRRTAFMDSNIKRYNERLQLTDDTIKKSIEELSLTKYDQWFKVSPINPSSLTFRDFRKEINFIKAPDPLFKFYAFAVAVVLIFVIIIHNITKPEWSSPSGYIFLVLLIVIIVPLCWSDFIWKCCAELPKSNFMQKYFQNCSEKITENVGFRMLLYILMWCMCTATVILEMVQCEHFNNSTSNGTRNMFFKYLFQFNKEGSAPKDIVCVIPWHMTETIALAIICNFAFLKMHIWLKLLFASIITILYSALLWNFDEDYFDYETYNYNMTPIIAHILNIVFLTISLHAVDRQTDFMNRLDHLLNLEQSAKQEEALAVRRSNESLINNILPIHVAKHYLDLNRETGTLYYEEYSASKPVAVMFAAITLQASELEDQAFLTCMNERIEDFDQILMQKYENKIEKIKIANWTYMAACGLDPGKRDSFFGHNAKVGERENIVVINLLEFAAEILKHKHDQFFDNQFQVKLRIGISHGEVTAGVVGSKKPLYDIWGDAVNMASRMESTGESGCIQVTENTAKIFENLGYSCQYRGKIKVKGKDSEIPTYFIDVDDEGNLVKIAE